MTTPHMNLLRWALSGLLWADFEKASGSVLAALQPYWPAEAAAALRRGGFKIRYTKYDWSLNQAPRP